MVELKGSREMSKSAVNPKDFTVEQKKNETVIRKPGTINGQQFIIQDCQDSYILLLDHMNVVTIDDCKNCQIVLGPTRGSVFIRNSENCRLVAACQQFRARDCLKLRISLLCTSQPSIEFCSALKFSCIQLNYRGLKEQMTEAQLNPFTNFWYEVYDFTPSQVVHNWTYSKAYMKVFSEVDSEELDGLDITEEPEESAVPRVHGTRKCTPKSHDRVFIFSGKDCEDKAFKCVRMLTEKGHHLVRSRRLEKTGARGLEQVLGEAWCGAPSALGGGTGHSISVQSGAIVLLHFTGDYLPADVAQQNNLHTSCDHRLISTLFVQPPANNHTHSNGGYLPTTAPPVQALKV
ncbi:protein XRP2-like isoform X2 [Varroa destructor]|uniref:C-CAP/cofactor C-like domain-containing protein n=1 Tax=Varroa destructor TaxID=109461 RepID=A0A7M7JVW3_VARDE|nr:protein XRP2-like isoform X2 [Varroa destructor]